VRAIGRQPQRAPDGAPVHDERYRPEQTTLYSLVQQHAASFIAHTHASTESALPRFIKDTHEEGVLRSAADANVGSIFGWEFALFHGGALQFINAMGAQAFVRRARELAAHHGPRFEPEAVVVRQAESSGWRFVDGCPRRGARAAATPGRPGQGARAG
jgi:hypothetical protein